jgi:transcriptional accessory protein Tex/SPT6
LTDDPLDASGVHPEAYPVVRRIIQAAKSDIKNLIGNTEAKLVGYAYAFEQASGLRKLPKSTPPLPNEP